MGSKLAFFRGCHSCSEAYNVSHKAGVGKLGAVSTSIRVKLFLEVTSNKIVSGTITSKIASSNIFQAIHYY